MTSSQDSSPPPTDGPLRGPDRLRQVLADYRSGLPLASFDSATTRELDAEAIDTVLDTLTQAEADRTLFWTALQLVCHDCFPDTEVAVERYLGAALTRLQSSQPVLACTAKGRGVYLAHGPHGWTQDGISYRCGGLAITDARPGVDVVEPF